MAVRLSAGILLYRRPAGAAVEVLLAHPGGPFWARKDAGAWSIPKGSYEPEVDASQLAAAVREFTEEVGVTPPSGPYLDLGTVTLASRKVVAAWAVEGDLDPAVATSNTFDLEWPAGSGRTRSFLEVDRVDWFDIDTARAKLNGGQVPLLDRLVTALAPI
jgi:predicted NUDIX family NTP pyrophosphohydrolase